MSGLGAGRHIHPDRLGSLGVGSLFFGDRGVLLELARKLNDLSKYVEKTLLDVMNTKRSKVDLRWKVSPRFRGRWM